MRNRIRALFLAAIAAIMVLAGMTPAHAATRHYFWSGNSGHHLCSPSLTSSHPWKLEVDYDETTLGGLVDMARFNDTNHTYAAWRRGEGSWPLSKGYLPADNKTHEHACATIDPGDTGFITVSAWYVS